MTSRFDSSEIRNTNDSTLAESLKSPELTSDADNRPALLSPEEIRPLHRSRSPMMPNPKGRKRGVSIVATSSPVLKRMREESSDSKENSSGAAQKKNMNIRKNRKPLRTVISFDENELSSNDEDV